MVPEFSSGLPDFVQDHLVMEQCYLGNNSVNNYDLAVGNLPDFTPSRDNTNGDKSMNKPIPLDLPFRPQTFPLDLPMSGVSGNGLRSSSVVSEVYVLEYFVLIDFL